MSSTASVSDDARTLSRNSISSEGRAATGSCGTELFQHMEPAAPPVLMASTVSAYCPASVGAAQEESAPGAGFPNASVKPCASPCLEEGLSVSLSDASIFSECLLDGSQVDVDCNPECTPAQPVSGGEVPRTRYNSDLSLELSVDVSLDDSRSVQDDVPRGLHLTAKQASTLAGVIAKAEEDVRQLMAASSPWNKSASTPSHGGALSVATMSVSTSACESVPTLASSVSASPYTSPFPPPRTPHASSPVKLRNCTPSYDLCRRVTEESVDPSALVGVPAARPGPLTVDTATDRIQGWLVSQLSRHMLNELRQAQGLPPTPTHARTPVHT